MRWRQGFFRLWVVLSIVWIGFVAFLAYDAYKVRSMRPEPVTVVPGLCGQMRGEAGVDYGFDRSIGPWDRYKTKFNFFDTCWTRLPAYRRLWPTETAGRSDADILASTHASMNVTQSAPIPKPSTTDILPTFAFALGYPLAVLVVGWALAWALGGFKKRLSTKPPEAV